jgi:hypothetical protein
MPVGYNAQGFGKPKPGVQINRQDPLAAGLVCQIPMNEGSGTSCWEYAGNIPAVQYIPPVVTASATTAGTSISTTQTTDQYFQNEYLLPITSTLGNTGAKQCTGVTPGSPNSLAFASGWTFGVTTGDTFRCQPVDLNWKTGSSADGWLWGNGADNPVIDVFPAGTRSYMNSLVLGMDRQTGQALYDPFYTLWGGTVKQTGIGYTCAALCEIVVGSAVGGSYFPDTDGTAGYGPAGGSLAANKYRMTLDQAGGGVIGPGGTDSIPAQQSKWALILCAIDKSGARLYGNQTSTPTQTISYPSTVVLTPTANVYYTLTPGAQASGSTASRRGHVWFFSGWLLNQGASNLLGQFSGKVASYWLWNRSLAFNEIVRFYREPWGMYQQSALPFYSFWGAAGVLTPDMFVPAFMTTQAAPPFNVNTGAVGY